MTQTFIFGEPFAIDSYAVGQSRFTCLRDHMDIKEDWRRDSIFITSVFLLILSRAIRWHYAGNYLKVVFREFGIHREESLGEGI